MEKITTSLIVKMIDQNRASCHVLLDPRSKSSGTPHLTQALEDGRSEELLACHHRRLTLVFA